MKSRAIRQLDRQLGAVYSSTSSQAAAGCQVSGNCVRECGLAVGGAQLQTFRADLS